DEDESPHQARGQRECHAHPHVRIPRRSIKSRMPNNVFPVPGTPDRRCRPAGSAYNRAMERVEPPVALPAKPVTRKLAAIMVLDVVGYSRLMGTDEQGTLARLLRLRGTLLDPAIARHGGRIVKTLGDGLLIEFASAVAAVQCAVDIQQA